jgi:hypothetical protein
VLFQDRIASGDALVADEDALGALGWIGDQCVNLILAFAAKRTSGDFLLRAWLAEHDPSMAKRAAEVQDPQVQIGAAHRAKALRFSNASEDAAPGSQKMACLRMTFEAN